MFIWRYKVEATVNSCVFDVMPVETSLVIIILLKLLLHITGNRLPTVHSEQWHIFNPGQMSMTVL